MSFYTNVAKYGNKINFRGYDDDGKRIASNQVYNPVLYYPLQNSSTEEPDAFTLDGRPLYAREFEGIKKAKETIDSLSGVNGAECYGTNSFETAFITDYFPDKINWNPNFIQIATIDIEVVSRKEFPSPEEAKHPIVSICIHESKKDIYYVLASHGSQKYSADISEYEEIKHKIKYLHFDDEVSLLKVFIKLFRKIDPDVITGWFINSFDIPYIFNRMHRFADEGVRASQMSPWGFVYSYNKRVTDGNYTRSFMAFNICGVSILDYVDVYKKIGYIYPSPENYKLDTIARQILGDNVGKMDYSEYGNLTNLYDENFQKYIDYNIRDVHLVVMMEQESNLLMQAITIAYIAGANYADALGTVDIWHTILYRHLDKKNIKPNALYPENYKRAFEGAYVKEPIPSYYEWVVSFDIASLYPNTIVQYNMSPETFVGVKEGVNVYDALEGRLPEPEENCSIALNGAMYSKDKQGFIPEVIEQFATQRNEIKKHMKVVKEKEGKDAQSFKKLDNEQMSIKILMNSLYGAISNIMFNYYKLETAAAITSSGRFAILSIEKAVNNFLNQKMNTTGKDYVLAIDTDSVYLNLATLVGKSGLTNKEEILDYLDEFAKKEVQPVIQKSFEEQFRFTNAFKKRMIMEREVIADKGIWTAKKRYLLSVLDSEGYRPPEPELKIMGLETVRSTTPNICRDMLKRIFPRILYDDEFTVDKLVCKDREFFYNASVEDIAIPKTANNLEKYYDPKNIFKKGTPIQVRAALLYNDALKRHELDGKYRPIYSGDKIKYVYLTLPNSINQNVIAFPDILPEEFGLHKSIDYNTQFKKVYHAPLMPLYGARGWSITDSYTFDSLF